MARVPSATYRIQLSREFGFADLEAISGYLDSLGVGACYCSPILQAGEGSSHGYDISDHGTLSPELGGTKVFARAAIALRDRSLGLVVDFVPNHMGLDASRNAWWRDVLEHGRHSRYAGYFDIDWESARAQLGERLLLPILADQYGAVLERGELRLDFDAGALVVRYANHRLPLSPEQTRVVLAEAYDRLQERAGPGHSEVVELAAIIEELTSGVEGAGAPPIEVQRERTGRARQSLARLVSESELVATHVREALAAFNGHPGNADSFDRLHGLLEAQAYRLSYWRTAVDEINYRRFFDVNELGGLRMEDPLVFAETHKLLLELVQEGLVSGIRIDHPDGLFDPAGYFRSLRGALAERQRDRGGSQVYLVAEKVLARGERLRRNWPVDGTTGYNFLNTLNAVYVHEAGLARLRRAYRRFSGFESSPADTVYASKRHVMESAMASELGVLARALKRLAERDRSRRDFTLNGLRRALREVIACFPVYRTYVNGGGAAHTDVAFVDAAVNEARRRNPTHEPSIFDFIHDVLLPRAPGTGDPDKDRESRHAFAQRFQQYTAAVMAKGVEDTAFYNDVLLLSANEVGSDLHHPSRPVVELHEDNAYRLSHWPLEMIAASTHDCKRGEDARARINVIAQLPDEWAAHVRRWASLNEAARTLVRGVRAPDRNDEWLFYQALLGAWPAEHLRSAVHRADDEFVGRMQGYMRKAVREAKRHTSWLRENVEYEDAVEAFVDSVLCGDRAGPFVASFVPFAHRIAWFGMIESLAQLVIRLGSPGVPDIYQGTELWNLSLVDPDNRRPVDFDERRRLLCGLEPLLAHPGEHDARWSGPHTANSYSVDTRVTALGELLESWTDGRVKLFTTAAALRFRRRHVDLFRSGAYQPLGSTSEHVVAFSRRSAGEEAIVMAPRFAATLYRGNVSSSLTAAWESAGIRLPGRMSHARLVNVFSGEVVEPEIRDGEPWLAAEHAFRSWPVAILSVS